MTPLSEPSDPDLPGIGSARKREKDVEDDKAGSGGPQGKRMWKEELTEIGPQVHTAKHLDSQIVVHFS